MATYRTKDGDTLDVICIRYYQRAERYVEAVLDANPGLAELGPVLPAGVWIHLPDFPELTAHTETVRLWS